MTEITEAVVSAPQWPAGEPTRVPLWIYSDEALYRRELDRFFYGPEWCFVGLSAEVPNAGDFKTTSIGERSVIITRDTTGELHALENRCAHRGVQLCHEPFGHAARLRCPYHHWTYRLDGTLVGLPFRNGVRGRGGMDEDFDLADHPLARLVVHERNGVVFAAFDPTVEPFERWLGPKMLQWFDRVFDGRPLRVLGDIHQHINANWKLMFDNIKDPYHASVLHVFLVSFGLFRADNPSATEIDSTGRHSVLVCERRRPASGEAADLESYRPDLELNDPRLLDIVREFPGEATLVMQTLSPTLVIQQQSNTLAVRQVVPRGVGGHELHWTFFGYEDDDDDMTLRRLRQANLMGPAGYVSLDDGEVLGLTQAGVRNAPGERSVLAMGGDSISDTDHVVTEAAIRAFYTYYRDAMGL
ncbi:MAG: salicylate 5-hydroxylase large subunit [Acidimicrobiaceae bacterium]|jgi:salicylate 5-hydroxylase large subunit